MIVASTDEPLPRDTEERLEKFTELVATAIANAESRTEVERLASQQAALRRVATLVAEGAAPAEVFTAVAWEVAQRFDFAAVTLSRYEDDAVVVLADPRTAASPSAAAGRSTATASRCECVRPGEWPGSMTTPTSKGRPPPACGRVIRGRLSASRSSSKAASGASSASAPRRPSCCQPTSKRALPASSSSSGPRSRTARLATASGCWRTSRPRCGASRRWSPVTRRRREVFDAVATEVGALLDTDITVVGRYDGDGTATAIGSWSASPGGVPVGTRSAVGGRNVLTMVAETGRPARVDGYDDASGEAAEIARAHGWRSSIAAPIVVEGRLWGVMLVATQRPEPFPSAPRSGWPRSPI